MSADGCLDLFNRGIDLFNRNQFFEAHEVLEDVWRALSESESKSKSIARPCDSSENRSLRLHLQALIQLAVAFHHQSTGNTVGASSVLERALRNLDGAEHSFPHLDIDRLRAESRLWHQYLKARAVDRSTWQDSTSQNIWPEIAPPLPKIERRSSNEAN
jgi:predicted metal-dependent hydrolase